MPAYSAWAKVSCYIGKLGRWSPGILAKSGSLLQDFPNWK
ncbi:hypothetical protein YSA_00662 [Pseudomonas putida ND6]|uniref:Uncharacterized protein n=1 Tax=Pseudomonas putida ND6 TaxID=231023 RepID=I3UNR1_PSEPU|nr:hypothetical protein YSA_00662 [Pseudomonas putida ND6]